MKTFFLRPLEIALNRYLGLDPESKRRLHLLEGKTITIELKVVNILFQLTVRDQILHLTSGDNIPAEIKIRGTPLNLFRLALARDKKPRFFADDISIEGNAELGQHITDLFDQMEIDWEEYLSRAIGDIPAHEIGRFTKSILSWSKETKASLMQNVKEYIHEEKPWFPPREAIEDFFREVDDLRMDMDRLEARIRGLI